MLRQGLAALSGHAGEVGSTGGRGDGIRPCVRSQSRRLRQEASMGPAWGPGGSPRSRVGGGKGERALSLAPGRLSPPCWGPWSRAGIAYLESANIRVLQRELHPAERQSSAVKAVPMGGAVPSSVLPGDGCAVPAPSSPSSSPPHGVPIPSTSPPHLCPRGPRSAPPAPPSTASSPYLPTFRLPTMWLDFTSTTADTLPVWGESAELWPCSSHLTPNQAPRGMALTSRNAVGPLPTQGHGCTQH